MPDASPEEPLDVELVGLDCDPLEPERLLGSEPVDPEELLDEDEEDDVEPALPLEPELPLEPDEPPGEGIEDGDELGIVDDDVVLQPATAAAAATISSVHKPCMRFIVMPFQRRLERGPLSYWMRRPPDGSLGCPGQVPGVPAASGDEAAAGP